MKRPSTRSQASAVLVSAVLLAASGCTHGPAAQPAARATATATASEPSATPVVPSSPWRVEVTHVAGRLGDRDRQRVADGVRAALAGYLDAAFLSGPYPRSDFAGSFGSFTPGAARRARGDVALLTDRRFGETTHAVRATRRTAYLSVLAARGKVSGVTAAVDLVLLVDRGERPAQRSHLTGRLLLTRTGSGPWRIFGYDVARSDVRKGS